MQSLQESSLFKPMKDVHSLLPSSKSETFILQRLDSTFFPFSLRDGRAQGMERTQTFELAKANAILNQLERM